MGGRSFRRTSRGLPWKVENTFLMSFRMSLLQGAEKKYPSSVEWARDSGLLGFKGHRYDLVQVIDGDGKKLQPAFNEWVSYCEKHSESGEHFYWGVKAANETVVQPTTWLEDTIGPLVR